MTHGVSAKKWAEIRPVRATAVAPDCVFTELGGCTPWTVYWRLGLTPSDMCRGVRHPSTFNAVDDLLGHGQIASVEGQQRQ